MNYSTSTFHNITEVNIKSNTVTPAETGTPFKVTKITITDVDGSSHEVTLFGDVKITLGN